jgi:hypothetical protein
LGEKQKFKTLRSGGDARRLWEWRRCKTVEEWRRCKTALVVFDFEI